LKIILFK